MAIPQTMPSATICAFCRGQLSDPLPNKCPHCAEDLNTLQHRIMSDFLQLEDRRFFETLEKVSRS